MILRTKHRAMLSALSILKSSRESRRDRWGARARAGAPRFRCKSGCRAPPRPPARAEDRRSRRARARPLTPKRVRGLARDGAQQIVTRATSVDRGFGVRRWVHLGGVLWAFAKGGRPNSRASPSLSARASAQPWLAIRVALLAVDEFRHGLLFPVHAPACWRGPRWWPGIARLKHGEETLCIPCSEPHPEGSKPRRLRRLVRVAGEAVCRSTVSPPCYGIPDTLRARIWTLWTRSGSARPGFGGISPSFSCLGISQLLLRWRHAAVKVAVALVRRTCCFPLLVLRPEDTRMLRGPAGSSKHVPNIVRPARETDHQRCAECGRRTRLSMSSHMWGLLGGRALRPIGVRDGGSSPKSGRRAGQKPTGGGHDARLPRLMPLLLRLDFERCL